jgi:uncharacterized membrane protein (UPF0127 family)
MKDCVYIAGQPFPALIAVSEEEHMQGLMFRPWPPPVMCFPYKRAEVRKFWMKNTISPLDILFCRDNRIISICHGEPLSTTLIGPEEECDLVVELPAGTAQAKGISVGDSATLYYTPSTAARQIIS